MSVFGSSFSSSLIYSQERPEGTEGLWTSRCPFRELDYLTPKINSLAIPQIPEGAGVCLPLGVFLSQNVEPGACAGVRDVSALGVEAARVSVLGRGSNRGFGLDGVNDGWAVGSE